MGLIIRETFDRHLKFAVGVEPKSDVPPVSARRLPKAVLAVCLDNLCAGRPDNVAPLMAHERFKLVKYHVCEYLHVKGSVDAVMHVASPASP